MLFSSAVFIFLFLPTTLLVFYALSAVSSQAVAKSWLILASLFFYGYWNPPYTFLILLSIVVNYTVGSFMARQGTVSQRRAFLVLGLIFNLGLIGYFKYANFFVDTLNTLAYSNIFLAGIILPLGISFFTFQQIAYLADTFNEPEKRYHPINYCLFVLFFPQLIAGPILHPKEILPQFERERYRFRQDDFTIGLTMFLLGLFKKVLIADSVAQFATPVFSAVAGGAEPTLIEAWGGVLAYTLQLYFDFSGYSDMAIGLGRMFGIKIALNFNSPYKARNIIDFWRRWHITLSRWLREYLYIPLGGNRKGPARRYLNLMITMLLGGLWHGAGWTFVFWGVLHGAYLVVNNGWQALQKRTNTARFFDNPWGLGLSRAITFLAVVVGWVFFRAENWQTATSLLAGMVGLNGVSVLPELQAYASSLQALGVTFNGFGTFSAWGIVWIVPLLFVVWFAPNPQQWMADTEPTVEPVEQPARRQWRPTALTGIILGALFFLVVKGYFMMVPSEFLYFDF